MPVNNDHFFMTEALRLAEQGLYTTSPNPRVGCLIVNQGEVVGKGWHTHAGGDHAEVVALAQAGKKSQGATVFITLEPCCHHGRTPPCSQALIKAHVARVVVASLDPNPQVAGRGITELEKAGIKTQVGLLEQSSKKLNAGFYMRMMHKRPYVRCKMAMSIDGRTALTNGESQWITSSAARIDVQKLRARSCAILTGSGTVLTDNPSMNVRWGELEGLVSKKHQRNPLRVIVDSQSRITSGQKIFTTEGKVLITSVNENAGSFPEETSTVTLPDNNGQVDLASLMTLLASKEVNELLLESGSTLAGNMLQSGFVDELIIYMAPKLLGSEAKGLFHLPFIEKMKDAVNLKMLDVRNVGNDIRMTLKVA